MLVGSSFVQIFDYSQLYSIEKIKIFLIWLIFEKKIYLRIELAYDRLWKMSALLVSDLFWNTLRSTKIKFYFMRSLKLLNYSLSSKSLVLRHSWSNSPVCIRNRFLSAQELFSPLNNEKHKIIFNHFLNDQIINKDIYSPCATTSKVTI